MTEKRRVKRFKEKNDVTITMVSDAKTNSTEKIICSQSNDISVLGTKIQVNYFLPVNSLLRIDFHFKDLVHKLSAIGRVKWIQNLFKDKSSYEAGVEFVDSSSEDIEKRSKYIADRTRQAED